MPEEIKEDTRIDKNFPEWHQRNKAAKPSEPEEPKPPDQ